MSDSLSVFCSLRFICGTFFSLFLHSLRLICLYLCWGKAVTAFSTRFQIHNHVQVLKDCLCFVFAAPLQFSFKPYFCWCLLFHFQTNRKSTTNANGKQLNGNASSWNMSYLACMTGVIIGGFVFWQYSRKLNNNTFQLFSCNQTLSNSHVFLRQSSKFLASC